MYVVPVSTNFSRHDLFQSDFVEKLESIRTKYDVPVKYLRVEITESVVIGSSQLVNDVVKKLHHFGYIVQMDDFGSAYSSLNALKDINLDILKLDMKFLADCFKLPPLVCGVISIDIDAASNNVLNVPFKGSKTFCLNFCLTAPA